MKMSSPSTRPCGAAVVTTIGVALVMAEIARCGHSLPTPSWSMQTRRTRETCWLPRLSAARTAMQAQPSWMLLAKSSNWLPTHWGALGITGASDQMAGSLLNDVGNRHGEVGGEAERIGVSGVDARLAVAATDR